MSELKKIKCPRCRAESSWQDNPYRPFCSEKCRMVDLGHWADESYRIPSRDVSFEDNVVAFEQPGTEEEES